jgi:ClpP class serine protease
VLHTPGGLVLAAMQIARAVEAHKAKVTSQSASTGGLSPAGVKIWASGRG